MTSSKRNSLLAVLLSSTALTALPEIPCAQTVVPLPGISVQGASLALPRSVPQAPAASNAPVQAPTTPEETVDGIPLQQVGSAVTVVTRADLDRQQIRNTADALRSLPGVSVSQQGTPGNLTVVRIRGAESRHTLVLIDGVEMNSVTEGFFDFSNLSADDIARIEVLRGPQSGLYGNGALGGVISITTRSGKGPAKVVVQAEGGSLGTGRLGAQLSGGNAHAWGSIAATAFRTNGFNISPTGDEADSTRLRSFATKAGLALSPALRIEGNFRQQTTTAGFDSAFGVLNGFTVPADAPYTGEGRTRAAGLSATLDTFSKLWTHNVYLQGSDTLREDVTTVTSETKGANYKFGYRSTLVLEGAAASPARHVLTGLIESRTETFQQPNFSATEYERHRNSVAGEIRGEYFRSLFLAATLRHDANDTTQDFTTWSVNGSYLLPGGLFRAHASTGTGVKYPGFADLYGFFQGFTPNPALKPETSVGYDFGVEATLLGGRATIDTTYFHADLQNEIAFNPAFVPTLVNLGAPSTRQGIEIAARYRLTPLISLGGAYTYLDAREASGVAEIRRPPHQGRIDVNVVSPDRRGNFNVAAAYNGDMTDRAFQPNPPFGSATVTLPAFWNVRVATSYKVQQGVEVFGRVENLLNQHWQEVYGYNASAGITAFAGVKLTFGGEDGLGATAGR